MKEPGTHKIRHMIKVRNSPRCPSIILTIAAFFLTCHVATASATTYYVSQSTGNDSASGTSPDAAWKTLSKASREYQAGDSVLLKCGDTWDEELRPLGEGTAVNPITISSYGDGPRPLIDRQDATGNNTDKVGIRLKNIAGYKITGLAFARFGRGVFVDFDMCGLRIVTSTMPSITTAKAGTPQMYPQTEAQGRITCLMSASGFRRGKRRM
jgi:hypothetical protein